MKRLRKTTIVIAVFILIIGICCVFYGPFSNMMYNEEQKRAIQEYIDTYCSNTNNYGNKSTDKKNSNNTKLNNINIEQLRKDIKRYNNDLVIKGQDGLQNKLYYSQTPLYLSDYGIKNNIYGYIQIEKLKLNMPIYLGADDYNMSLGAAQMNYSSIPYGGKNTNAVLAGHCGYGYCDYFRHLEDLSVGNEVVILTPFKKLKYKVSEINIVEPTDISKLVIVKNKDLITLVTCHPYPTSNYRLIVTCETQVHRK